MELQEKDLKTCLDSGFKEGVPPATRQRLVAKLPEWQMLDKPWKSLLLLALHEVQVPSDEDEGSHSPSFRGRRGVRTRRGARGNSGGPLEWLPESSEVLLDEGSPSAFRLSVLLIRRTLFKDDWNESWDSVIDELRDSCMSDGVHPAWTTMAEATPILAQFAAFPVDASEVIEENSVDLAAAWVDPADAKAVSIAIKALSPAASGATAQVAVQKAIAQLRGNRGLRDIGPLVSLDGEGSAISALLQIHLGQDATDALKRLKKVDADLSIALSDIVALRDGKANDWDTSRSAPGEDGLSIARRITAWSMVPESAAELSSADLEIGLSSVTGSKNRETIQWWLLSALVKEGVSESAFDILSSIRLEADADLSILIPLVKKLGDPAIDWVKHQISGLHEGPLSELVSDVELDLSVRVAAARRLHDIGAELGLDSSIDLFSRGLDLNRLADLLIEDSQRCADHPYETLMVAHLLPARTKGYTFDSIRAARRAALGTVQEMEIPDAFSDAAKGLLLVLDGAAANDGSVVSKLNRNGLLAFNKCRQALKDGGDGLTESKTIDTLVKSIESAKLTEIENRLFRAVIDTLRLNRAAWLLQTSQNDGVVELLNGLLSGDVTAMPMMQAVRHLVLEYDIGLPNLVSWYQENDPQSPWHTLARAAINVSKGDELNAARDYRRAGDHSDFDYEHRIMLYRKALIHLAHAEQWSEAVDLLETEPALKAALTRRFQLYLNVSHSAATRGKTDDATRLLKSYVRRTRTVREENQQGEVKMVERVFHSDEDLDLLRNYPSSHSRHLPQEPFIGRVKAAVNSLQRERRRNRHTFENRYAQAMQLEPVSREEIYEIAVDAAAEKPLEGLMILERAQNSGKFSILDSKRLADAERGLFSNHKHNLPVKSRAYLRHLSLNPLVIVDTNILIDELHHRLAEKLEIAAEAALDIGGRGRFHRILKRRSDEGRILLWLPKVIRNELIEISKDIPRVRSGFNDTLVAKERLDAVMNSETIGEIVSGIMSDFSTWKPLDLHVEDEVDDEEVRAQLKKFLLDHEVVYDELTAMKRRNYEPIRTVIDGKDFYPEVADQTLMCLASILANRPLGEIGNILVATRDGDFTLVARAVEERLGFGVVKNSRDLNAR